MSTSSIHEDYLDPDRYYETLEGDVSPEAYSEDKDLHWEFVKQLTVICHHCYQYSDADKLGPEAIDTTDEWERDKVIFICPHCKKETSSLVLG